MDAAEARLAAEVYHLPHLTIEVPPPAAARVEEVRYGEVGDRPLVGTLYRPRKTGAGRHPAVVYMHGGGWSGGTREQFHRHALAMTQLGFVGLCVTYRLSGEARFPAAVEDGKCAVRWLRAHAAALGVDPDRLGAAGGSAGGHLAGMIANCPDRADWEGTGGAADQSSRVQAAVLFNPVLDCFRLRQHGGPSRMMIDFLGADGDAAADLYRDASPAHHVGAATPPTLVLHGMADQLIPCGWVSDYTVAIRAAGGTAGDILVPACGHGWFNHDPHFRPCLQAMANWFLTHLAD